MRQLSHHILDIVENSLEAGASRVDINVKELPQENLLSIQVCDNGRGMDAETVARLSDPFFTTRKTRHVGLGIPLFKAAAERCNGRLTITSQPSQGTQVMAEFERDHIDRAPLGDIVGTLLAIILAQRVCDLRYCHQVGDLCFEFDTADIRRELGDIPLTHPQVRDWLKRFIEEGEAELHATAQVGRPASAGHVLCPQRSELPSTESGLIKRV